MLRGKTAENSNLLRAAEGGSYEEIYVQNILPGPLSILDPPTVKDGLYLDPIPSGDIMDLSYYNIKDLLKSPAFRSALQHGYIRELSRNEYDMQINLKREKEIMLQERLRAKRVAAEANGDVFEAESINLASAGNPHGDYSAEALLAQQNVESMDGWAQSYEDALNDGIVRTPQEFAEKVDRGELSVGGRTGGRGRKISLANNMTDQITMTKTQATVGVPSEYQGLSMSGEVERHGEIVAQKRNMSNFNTMNTGMPVDESFVESIDLEQDESQYEMNKRMKYEGVANQQKMINRRE